MKGNLYARLTLHEKRLCCQLLGWWHNEHFDPATLAFVDIEKLLRILDNTRQSWNSIRLNRIYYKLTEE